MSRTEDYKIHSANSIPWKLCKKAERIVIKLGTRSLIHEDRSFNDEIFRNLALDISKLYSQGKEIIIVSSGAVNAGVNALGLLKRPRDLHSLQAMAAVGNPILMEQYKKYFTFCNLAQILVTQEDLSIRESYNNFKNTLKEIISRRIIPIINENDVVSVNELRNRKDMQLNFTDNDILAGLISASLKADLLLILSDVDGLYTKHPNSPYADFVPYIPKITSEVINMAQTGNELGRGGMISKIIAGQIMTYSGGTMVIGNAKTTRVKDILNGCEKCTFFAPREDQKLRSKEIWLMFAANVKGNIFIDSGASRAIQNGASLLFNGITRFTGKFRKKDIVEIYEVKERDPSLTLKEHPENFELIARARTRYSSEEMFKTLSTNFQFDSDM